MEKTFDGEKGKVKLLSLRRNFSWTLLGNTTYAGCQWGMLVALAKLGSPENVGQLALGFAITAPVFMFTNLNLRAVQATDAKHSFSFNDYLGVRIHTTIIALIFISILIAITDYKFETTLVIISIAFLKSIESISDSFCGLFQKHELMEIISKSMIMKGLLSLFTFSSTYYLTKNLFTSIMFAAMAKTIVIILYEKKNVSELFKYENYCTNASGKIKIDLFNNVVFKRLTLLSLPLGIVTMLNSLNTNIPRYFLERSFGERDLGIFAAMAYLMVFGTTVITALGQSASPRLAKHFAANNIPEFRNLMMKLIYIGVILGIFGIIVVYFFGKDLLTLLYSKEYIVYSDVMILIMIASCLSYISSFLGVAMTSARYFKIQMPITILSFAVIFIVSFSLIPEIGVKGAAISMICLYAAQIPFKSYVIYRLTN